MKKILILINLALIIISACKKEESKGTPITEVSGTIYEPTLNKNIKAVTVDLLIRKAGNGVTGGSYSLVKSIKTDSNGYFKFTDLPDPYGDYNLDITKPYDIYTDILNLPVDANNCKNRRIGLYAHSILKLTLINKNKYFPQKGVNYYRLYIGGIIELPGYGEGKQLESFGGIGAKNISYNFLSRTVGINNYKVDLSVVKDGGKDTTIYQYINGIPADTVEMNFEF